MGLSQPQVFQGVAPKFVPNCGGIIFVVKFLGDHHHAAAFGLLRPLAEVAGEQEQNPVVFGGNQNLNVGQVGRHVELDLPLPQLYGDWLAGPLVGPALVLFVEAINPKLRHLLLHHFSPASRFCERRPSQFDHAVRFNGTVNGKSKSDGGTPVLARDCGLPLLND